MSPFARVTVNLLVGFGRLPLLRNAVPGLLLTWKHVCIKTMQRLDKRQVQSRTWSNYELRKIAPLVLGDVINVSGWRDQDKEGGHYRDYFCNARSYAVSNYTGENGLQGTAGEIELDLEKALPPQLLRRFDAVFNHTVLEHVFDFAKALDVLCELSRETVILVTPFIQSEHYAEGSYGDWWRFTPRCVRELLSRRGFTTVYQSANDNPWYHIYVFTVATRSPERYTGPREVISTKIGERAFTTGK